MLLDQNTQIMKVKWVISGLALPKKSQRTESLQQQQVCLAANPVSTKHTLTAVTVGYVARVNMLVVFISVKELTACWT